MCNNRDACLNDGLDTVGIFHTALKLYGLTVGLLHDTPCITYCILNGCLIRHKGHVDNYESVFGTPTYSLAVMYHIVNGDSQCVFVT